MKTIRSLEELGPSSRPAAVAIGVFDGVHLGHREILRRLFSHAGETGAETVLFTFDPHPRTVLHPEHPPRILTTLSERSAIFERFGVEKVVILPFNRELAATGAEEFVREVLIAKVRMTTLVVGYDFRLGREREGNGGLLRDLARATPFRLDLVPPFLVEGKPVKSTWIRDEVEGGDVKAAARLLSRYHSLSGVVVGGDGRGRSLGFPTANISVTEEGKLWPRHGVYAAFAEWSGGLFPAVVNIGVRPTFGGTADKSPTLEAHLIRFTGGLVGERMRVHFVDRIRGERAFPSPEALAAQIGEDRDRGEEILAVAEKKNSLYSGSGIW
jgi:riboflavin kinase/FMN adenylyltransferase